MSNGDGYYAVTTRGMLREAKAIGRVPFVLFQYYLTYTTAPEGIKPGLRTIADDLGVSKNTVCNARNVLVEHGWIRYENEQVFITKAFISNERHSSDMNERSSDMNGTKVANIGISYEKEKEEDVALSNIEELFQFWKTTFGLNGNTFLTTERRTAIVKQLKLYGVERIKNAILGCSVTPHNIGQNDRGEKYIDIELICRKGMNVERFENTWLSRKQKPAMSQEEIEGRRDILASQEAFYGR